MSDSKAGSVTSISDGRVDSMAEMVKDDAPKEGQGSRFYVYFLSCFATLGGFLFGYDTGIVSGSMLLINPYFSLTTVWTEAIVSATIAAAAFFSIVAGISTDFLGRKKTIMLASFVFAIGAVVMGAARDKEMLLVGRIIVGMGIGKCFHLLCNFVYKKEMCAIQNEKMTLTVKHIKKPYYTLVLNVPFDPDMNYICPNSVLIKLA